MESAEVPGAKFDTYRPQARQDFKGVPLANESAKRALIASVPVFAVLLLSMPFDFGSGSCFR